LSGMAVFISGDGLRIKSGVAFKMNLDRAGFMAAWGNRGICSRVLHADTWPRRPCWGRVYCIRSAVGLLDESNCSGNRCCPAKRAPPA
jgi:hypothetical protein